MSDFFFRTLSPPEHRHLQRLVAMLVSVLQEFRLAAFSTSGRWNLNRLVLENLQQILGFSFRIQHLEFRKQPFLKFFR